MKASLQIQITTLLMAIVLSSVSCKKEIRMPAIINKPPFANAGTDIAIMLPDDHVNLNGTASYDPDGNIRSFEWRQVSGAVVPIVISQAAKTTAIVSSPGVYQFELKVTDDGGLSSNDTMSVTVTARASDQTESPFYFRNLVWIFPWYASLEVRNIYSYVPKGQPFSVYVQRSFNPAWIEAHPISDTAINNTYEYFIETRWDGAGIYNYGSLYIFYYGGDTHDTPNVKVEF